MSDIESQMNVTVSTESELLGVILKLSTEIFNELPLQIQY